MTRAIVLSPIVGDKLDWHCLCSPFQGKLRLGVGSFTVMYMELSNPQLWSEEVRSGDGTASHM